MRTEYLTIVTRPLLLITISALLLGGCSNSKLRRTPTVVKQSPWFCELNAAGDDWTCVRDEQLARHPRPSRLPGDVPEPAAATDLGPQRDTTDPGIDASAAGASSPMGGEDTLATAAAPDQAPPEPTPAAAHASNDKPADATPATSGGDPEEQLLALPGDMFVVQLIAFANESQAGQFVAERKLADSLPLRLARGEETYYVVLLGVYDTYADASAAVAARGETLADIEPWIRPLASVQAGLRAAQVLVAAGE